MELPIGGVIEGVITNHVSGQPQQRVCLEALLLNSGTFDYISGDASNSDGTYGLGGLPAGDYAVDVYPCQVDFEEMYYLNKPDLAHATLVSVGVGAHVTIDFDLTLTPLQGDGNCDGEVTMADVVAGLRSLGRLLGTHCFDQLDVNCSADTTATDILALLLHLSTQPGGLAGGHPCTPIGELLPTATPH
ncbi:MAG: hypothetical protein ABI559_04260 [Chloroflexota bacterium]